MTIDERLERLTERHEALTESVELMQRDYQQRFQQITRTFEIALDSIKRLEHIAAAHEQRIDHLEDRP